jgi:transposase
METETSVIWSGLDVGKKTFFASIDMKSESGARLMLDKLPTKEFRRNLNGVNLFLKWQQMLNPEHKNAIVMETTGCYSLELIAWIKMLRQDMTVSLQNARMVSDFIKSLNQPHKTDKNDAQAIARFGTERNPESAVMAEKHWLDLREFERERTALIEVRVDLENRAESLFTVVAKRANQKAISALNMEISEIEREIKHLVLEHEDIHSEVRILSTMPGVSFVSACAILAELGSLKQYDSRQISAISGLAPRIISSGTSLNKSFMGRRGSKRLRQILYLNSMSAVNKVPLLSSMYERLIEKGKSKMTARCACMSKLLLILRAMVVNNKPYDENYFKTFSKSA